MQILSVASEVFPLVKTGGLGDVTGALPKYLRRFGIQMKTLVPGYPALLRAVKAMEPVVQFDELFGGPATLLQARAADLDLLILHAPALYERGGGPYIDDQGNDHPDNWKRFAALSAVAAEIASGLMPQWCPDIVHTHDWQSALASVYMRYSRARHVPSVLTVHNLAFQGQFSAGILPALGLPPESHGIDCLEYHGDISFLKGGLQTANAITTVSPTYAREILTAEFGMGLEGVLNARVRDLVGIVNGIDTSIWDPASDAALVERYDYLDITPRLANRARLQTEFGLDSDDCPIFAVVSRLTWQKGMDILAAVVDGIVATGARLAILGSGDAGLEGSLLAAAARHRGRVGVVVGYDEGLSHMMQGGCDAIVIPSRFEPCGLTQLYGLRYGCVPIVARTGGLADTVIDANEAAMSAGVATGFQFAPNNGGALLHAIRRLVDAHADAGLWASIQRQGMKADVSWDRSAEKYVELYRLLLSKRAA